MTNEDSATWFSLELGDAVLATTPCSDIHAAFEPLFTAAGKPAHMAVFKRHDDARSLHCEIIAYFSPAAAGIARTFGAVPCVRPGRRGLELLAGDPAAWQALF